MGRKKTVLLGSAGHAIAEIGEYVTGSSINPI
jgi:hypothetical protein